jgi:hypothetical protein
MEDNVNADVVVGVVKGVEIGTTTGNLTAGLVTPDRVAVILVFPAATAVTEPDEDMVAIFGSELAQIT